MSKSLCAQNRVGEIINNDCFQVKCFNVCLCKCSRRDPEHEHIPKLWRLIHNLHPHCVYLSEACLPGLNCSTGAYFNLPHFISSLISFAAAEHEVIDPQCLQ